MISREENERLTKVGPGTPVGELLRRYWHPIAAVSELALNETKYVRILGEELVLFKDRQGRFGLVGAYCAHRRANLTYGIVEEDGLRCPYHGWKYDSTGRCVEQPFEETLRLSNAPSDKLTLSAYPVEQLGGLIFAYLGPSPAPLLPRCDLLIEENVWRETGYTVTLCNWLQTVENILDPVHVEWLHGVFRNYTTEHTGRTERQRKRIRHVKIAFDLTKYGIVTSQGALYDRTQENLADSDQRMVMYRHLLDGQIKWIEAGKDPMNVFRSAEKNQCLRLPTESREQFLTGRLGERWRY